MEPLRYRIFICTRERPAGQDACAAAGAVELLTALKKEFAARGAKAEVKVQSSSCFDLCSGGPHLVVYPEGRWYSGLRVEQVQDFVDQLLANEIYPLGLQSEEELQARLDARLAKA